MADLPCTRHIPRRCVVTGGMGFIGSHVVRHLLATDPALTVVTLDALTYAAAPDQLSDLPADHARRHHLVEADISDVDAVRQAFRTYEPDTVIHLAAESHVDRSIDDPLLFVRTNVLGTAVLLHEARRAWHTRDDVRFHHVSTDEVFGSLGERGAFTAASPYDPSSPYSASKAGADHLVRAWHRTYGLPVTISNCSNNYGAYQFPEKLIPLMITRALTGDTLPVYGDGQQVRDWLYVEDHAKAIDRIIRGAPTGTSWMVGGRAEISNHALVLLLCQILEAERPCGRAGGYHRQIRFVQDRPGHDRRYAVDPAVLERDLLWKPAETLATGLRKTIRWYLDHRAWVARLTAAQDVTQRRGLLPADPGREALPTAR